MNEMINQEGNKQLEMTKVGGELAMRMALFYTELTVSDPVMRQEVHTSLLPNLVTIYERRNLLSFDRQNRIFLLFHQEWRETVFGIFSMELEMKEICNNVPNDRELDLKNFKTMDKFWTLLETKFGQVHELTNDIVNELMQFTISNEVQTETQQFTELQRKLMQVVKDLKEVDGIKCFDKPVMIQTKSNKLLSKQCRD